MEEEWPSPAVDRGEMTGNLIPADVHINTPGGIPAIVGHQSDSQIILYLYVTPGFLVEDSFQQTIDRL